MMENSGNGPQLFALKANFNKKLGLNFNAISISGLAGSRQGVRIAIQDLMVAPWSVVMPPQETPQLLSR